MSKEKGFWVEADISELSQLLTHIRAEHLKKSTLELGSEIEMKSATIEDCEKGSSPYGFQILKKTCDKFNLDFKIIISTKD